MSYEASAFMLRSEIWNNQSHMLKVIKNIIYIYIYIHIHIYMYMCCCITRHELRLMLLQEARV